MTANALTPRRRLFREEEPEWLVWALILALLAIGMIVRTIVVTRTATFDEGSIAVSYPADWTPVASEAPGTVLSVGESFAGELFPARLTVQQLPVTDVSRTAQSLGDFALKWSNEQAEDLLGYRVLSIEPLRVREQDAVRVDYAYVAEPTFAAADAVPLVARGSDILMRGGDTMTVVRMVAASDAFDRLGPAYERIIGSIELKQE